MKRIIFLVMVPIVLGPTSLTTVSGITFGDWASDHGYGLGAVLPDMVNAKRSSIDDLNGIGDFDALNLSGGGLLAAWDVEPDTMWRSWLFPSRAASCCGGSLRMQFIYATATFFVQAIRAEV